MDAVIAAPLRSPLHQGSDQPRRSVRVTLVQTRWHSDPDEHRRVLADGIATAAANGADAVFLPELTLSRYPGDTPASGTPKDLAESLEDGPTVTFTRAQSIEHGVHVHASLYERPADDNQPDDPRGYNTAVLVAPDGTLVGRTRKTHIPISAGYHEDTYFRPGPDDDPFPVYDAAGTKIGLPTCWDEWFPEVARSYDFAGSEVPRLPDRHRFRAELPRLRHGSDLAARHRGERHHRRPVHGRPEPVGRRGGHHLLRLVVHLGPVRSSAHRSPS